MKNMSFMLTTQQMISRTKSVTRRVGWWFLKPGDVIMAVEKGMGLKKGEKVKQIYPIQILSVRKEPLIDITYLDLVKEGFPEMAEMEFIRMFCRSHKGCTPETIINRIEFKEHIA